MKRLVLFASMLAAALYCFAETRPQITFDQALQTYYRAVAVLKIHQLDYEHTMQTDSKNIDTAAEALHVACAGTVENMDKFEPVCKSGAVANPK
jgi:hypothetical protein